MKPPARRPSVRHLPGLLTAIACAISIVTAADKPTAEAPPEGMTVPRYAEDGRLMAPGDYRTWVFVGASLGLSYNEDAKNSPESAGFFHHTYMQPEAYKHYLATGRFPEKTMFILELYASEKGVAPDTSGLAQGRRVAVEVALKDHDRFENGWAYFNFPLKDNKPAPLARAMPQKMCYDCHAAHAEDDNVFTQFYPVLREAREERKASEAAAP